MKYNYQIIWKFLFFKIIYGKCLLVIEFCLCYNESFGILKQKVNYIILVNKYRNKINCKYNIKR